VDLSGYLTSSDAANTYLSQSDASSTYLTQSDASSTYLTQSDASSTYLSQSSASSTYATQTALGNTNAKVGSGTLDIGSDLTDGVNQLNSNLVNITPCYKENDYNFNICQIGHIVVVSGKITGKGTGGYITDVKLPQPAESGIHAVVTRARNIVTGAHVDLRAGDNFYIYREATFTNGEQYTFAFSYCAQI
jgi:hypothetical protein